MTEPVHLDAASIDAIAAQVAARLRESGTAGGLVDAAEVAHQIGTTTEWVYDHANELGVIRLGGGSKPRLRFDMATVRECLRAPEPAPARQRPARRRSSSGPRELLPVRGER